MILNQSLEHFTQNRIIQSKTSTQLRSRNPESQPSIDESAKGKERTESRKTRMHLVSMYYIFEML